MPDFVHRLPKLLQMEKQPEKETTALSRRWLHM